MIELVYPPGFPDAARARVEAQLAEAESVLSEHDGTRAEFWKDLCVALVLDVFSVFIDELTELARAEPGRHPALKWTAEIFRRAGEAFRDSLIAGVDRDCRPGRPVLHTARTSLVPGNISYGAFTPGYPRDDDTGAAGAFRAECLRAIRNRPFWAIHQQNVIALAESDDDGESRKRSSAEPPTGPASWKEVHLRFLSEHRVQVVLPSGPQPPASYAEFGCEDGRSRNPTKAWHTLLEFAKNDGELRVGAGPGREIIEKRIQEIRGLVRDRFKISDRDPIVCTHVEKDEHRRHTAYIAQFRVTLAPSFDS